MSKANCPCGSNKLFVTCCEPYLSGKESPPTPETLMRSRYTAFTQANMDYILATMQGEAAKDFDPVSAKEWAQQAQWLGLVIVKAPKLAADVTKGTVEFIARYQLQGVEQQIHEISEFNFIKNRWYYVDGRFINSAQSKSPRIGRNDPCSCGSGKKYKKCCSS